ncbi:MAG: hypothetical protein H6724_09585 [Sandaracinus sp.]|nr:hypothetical protein [Sandaracinus sp.]
MSRDSTRSTRLCQNARKVVVHVVVGRRDLVVMAMLRRIADDAAHPSVRGAPGFRDAGPGIIALLYARFVPKVLDEHPFNSYTLARARSDFRDGHRRRDA